MVLVAVSGALNPSARRSSIIMLVDSSSASASSVTLMRRQPGSDTRACRRFSVLFTRLEELLASMRKDADLPAAKLRYRKYLNVALLIIDEVGFEPMTRQEASLFFRLVSYRYGRGSILITTNKGIRDWPELLAGDEVMATAILDRLLHHSHVLNIKGRSYRLRDLEQAVSLQP